MSFVTLSPSPLLSVSVPPRETGVIGRTLVLRLPEKEPKGVIRLLNLEGVSLRKLRRSVLALLRRDDYLTLVSEYSK